MELLAFRDASDGLTLTEISNSLQSPKSSISPILHTMAKKKYLSYKPESSTYTLGIRTLEIGNAYMRKESFFERALTELQEVVDACNETCHLAELDGCNVLYLLKVDAPQSIRIRIERRTHSIAESLLMPAQLVRKNMAVVGLPEKIDILNRIYRKETYLKFEEMSSVMGVSKQALAIRMRSLGLLEKEYLSNPHEMLNVYVEEDYDG